MYKLPIIYYKPRYSGIAMADLDTTEDILTQVTTITKSSLKRGKKNIPVMPKIHADALVTLAKHNTRYVLGIAVYLSLHLTKSNPETVTLQAYKMGEELGLSEPSLLKGIKILESLGYIKSIGKSLYYIAPTLAFYGTSLEWSLALQIHKEGGTVEDFTKARDSIRKQIHDNETSVGVVNV